MVDRLPVVVWSRLYFDLKLYLTERSADDASLLAFYHRSLSEAVIADYLAGQQKQDRHHTLAQYFAAQALHMEKGEKRTPNLRKLSEMPYQQAYGGLGDALVRTLTTFDFMQAKVSAVGPQPLIEDYNFALSSSRAASKEVKGSERSLSLIQGALRLSAPILEQDLTQFPGQLTGRLLGLSTPEIQALLKQALKWQGSKWLRPLSPSFTPPGGALLQILTGHTLRINAVAVMPDGQRAVTVSDDCTLKVWDLESGVEIYTLSHKNPVFMVAITSDGQYAVSGCWDDPTLRVWDLESGIETHTLRGHAEMVNAVAVASDCPRLISISRRSLKVWDLKRAKELRTLTIDHTDWVLGVAVTSDGRRAVTASDDRTLKVWDLENGTALHTLKGHTNSVLAVAIASDNQYAVSASWDRTLKVWDLENGTVLHTLKGHTDAVHAVAVTTDGYIVSASWKEFLIWDLRTGAKLSTIDGHLDVGDVVAVASSGHRAVSVPTHRAFLETQLRVWDLRKGPEPDIPKGHANGVEALAVTPDGRMVVSASLDGTLKVWDLESGAELHTLTGHTGWVSAVAVTPDGRRAISGSGKWGETLKVWDLETGREIHTWTGHTNCVQAVVITPDGRHIVSASQDSTLRIWDLEKGMELRTLRCTRDPKPLVVTPDGQRAISGAGDGTLKVWDLETGQALYTLEGHTHMVQAIVVTPDGRRVASVDSVTMRIWDLASGAELCSLPTNSWRIALTPDGQRAVSADEDNHTLKVWDLEKGIELFTLMGHSQRIDAAEITADGQRVVSASMDWTLRVWDLARGEPLACFTGEAELHNCIVLPDGITVIVGDVLGRVYFLRLENVVPGPTIVTAWQSPADAEYAFGCPHCQMWSKISASALGIQGSCPYCGKAVKLNPFVIKADWRPVARAWHRNGKAAGQ
jgi:WD40 repeat protein